MVRVNAFYILLFSQLLSLLSTGEGHEKCPSSFNCGYLETIQFPFTTIERPDCGILALHGCGNDSVSSKGIQLKKGERYHVMHIDHSTIFVRDDHLHKLLQSRSCEIFNSNYTPNLPPTSPLASFDVKYNITLFKCNKSLHIPQPKLSFNYANCSNYNIYYFPREFELPMSNKPPPKAFAECSILQLPVKDEDDSNDPFTFLSAEVPIKVRFSEECAKCYYHERGMCQLDSRRKFLCVKDDRSWVRKLGIGIGFGILFILIVVFILLRYKQEFQLQSRNNSAHHFLDPESRNSYFGVIVFSYEELEEATNNFDRSKELGDGGFGTVYHGKLRDGREVAVKRLYEHNYKRVEQFMNEIAILTRLRHRNLVSLYGCTSRHSRGLLLVYEFIPNGTVGFHLRSHLAKSRLLSWHIRLKIAVETATALAYLHASDIIHRDVKSNNILLDNYYCVKVADFGLSRLFPNDVTHVSTAPQGTPGYVDPEYHQCYQLTSKSDVYSFGVVLVELISSKPAVDMSRHKDEINLANLALKKIQKSALSELVDPSLGFHSDDEIKRMITSTAELAFHCLQPDKELRPSMDEVLKVLKRIQSGKNEAEYLEEACVHDAEMSNGSVQSLRPASLDLDGVGLSKNMKIASSPKTVTDSWDSKSTTPNVSS
ncbi:hypothetical protein L6164_001694 [Bauhinia variegata]|uniref:Uncharacterized protein n=1 Tax=Bauhinia variegata TaxID=167791 RepID=A0ACB9QDJ7_BAUVA|nr:hypothetical protein L6164_001694 [Bauhinia variegata]